MEGPLDLLEEKFRRVEQASERRALDESDQDLSAESSTGPGRSCKKPAVSLSHFGKSDEQDDDGLSSQAPSPLSAVASRSTFYHTLANPKSVESFVLDKSDGESQHADEQHETRVERIVGRQTIPKTVDALLPRRLKRARSQMDYVSINKGVVIDVSVETTTEWSHHSASQTSVYAARPRAATVGALTSHGGLVERAKDFARKLRRKTKP